MPKPPNDPPSSGVPCTYRSTGSYAQAARCSALLGIDFDLQPRLAILRLGVCGADILTPNKPSLITSMICELRSINSHRASGTSHTHHGWLEANFTLISLGEDSIQIHILRIYTLVEKIYT